MTLTSGKILSLLIAAAYVLVAILAGGWGGIRVCFALLLPLALIWFPDELGSMTGFVGRGGYVDQESPPVLVSLMGWFFLVGFPILLWFLGR